ncbi:hypothetical protein TK5_25640 [Sideroxyarcus sp. TK5]
MAQVREPERDRILCAASRRVPNDQEASNGLLEADARRVSLCVLERLTTQRYWGLGMACCNFIEIIESWWLVISNLDVARVMPT